MSDDPFDKLLDIPVPPPPVDFDAHLNDRINRAITTEQLCDGLLRGLGSAAVELVAAICGGAFKAIERTEESTTDHKKPR
jgi:hypothetical protein